MLVRNFGLGAARVGGCVLVGLRGLGLRLGLVGRGLRLGGPTAREPAREVGPAARGVDTAGTVGADGLHAAAPQLELLGREAAHDDGDVAGPLADPRGPAPRPGTPALHGGTLVGVAGRDVEVFGVLLVVVDRVGHGRAEDLADDLGRLALGAGQDLGGALDVLAADQVEHLARLGRRHPAVAVYGARPGTLVGLGRGHRRAPRSWPAW